ncbi:MAG: septal ring lytic transglycosylase RlpA family protein [Nitrospirae bacterium]|nr:septal ring lytic transglycosylase RlpA family protein [Nitrospirota bacterium]
MSNMTTLTRLLLIPTLLMSFALSTASASTFSDVEEGNPYFVAISYLEKFGIVDGYSDGTFKPYDDVNRAEALKMLTIASGLFKDSEINALEAETARPFTDTPSSAWYTNYISAAKNEGIVNGYPDGSFKPEQTVTLAESLKIFFESLGNIEYPNIADYLLDDTPENAWYTAYTAYAASKGIINIYSTNTMSPNQDMSRGYLAEVIYRSLTSDNYLFGKATYYGSAVQGNHTASGEIFDMYEMTAAHKTLPFGTMVKVTNLANGKSIEVKINDRGPYGPGRIIDLSEMAFAEIASHSTGVINAQVEIISSP